MYDPDLVFNLFPAQVHSDTMKKGILLINLGTPDSPEVPEVRQFLREFLMDPLVIDLPYLSRWLLVNGIIVPFRGPKSAKEYQLLWTENGSPLKFHGERLLAKIQERLAGKYEVALAMRYRNPSIISTLEKLRSSGCEQLLIFPLFPQYAQATTQSTINKVNADLKKMKWDVKTDIIDYFPKDNGYIEALIECAESIRVKAVDHTVFSFHGLPERQLQKLNSNCLNSHCCDQLTAQNSNCYRAQCYATSRAIAEKIQLSESDYTVCFQSRQGNIPWIQPYTDEVIEKLANNGTQRLRVFSPAFVADCLETTIEIGHTYRQLFCDLGGEELYLVPGLNSSDRWVDALIHLIEARTSKESLSI